MNSKESTDPPPKRAVICPLGKATARTDSSKSRKKRYVDTLRIMLIFKLSFAAPFKKTNVASNEPNLRPKSQIVRKIPTIQDKITAVLPAPKASVDAARNFDADMPPTFVPGGPPDFARTDSLVTKRSRNDTPTFSRDNANIKNPIDHGNSLVRGGHSLASHSIQASTADKTMLNMKSIFFWRNFSPTRVDSFQ